MIIGTIRMIYGTDGCDTRIWFMDFKPEGDRKIILLQIINLTLKRQNK